MPYYQVFLLVQLVDTLRHPDISHTMLLLVDEEGRVVKSLHDPISKVVGLVTEAFEVDDEIIIVLMIVHI